MGVVVFHIDFDSFKRVCEKYSSTGSQVIVINQYNEVIYHTDGKNISKPAEKSILNLFNNPGKRYAITEYTNNKTLVNYISLDKKLLKLANIVPLDEIEKNRFIAMKVTIYIVLVVILFVIFISFLFNYTISKPIKTLSRTMKEVEKGNFAVTVKGSSHKDEISILNRSFNFMIKKIKEMIQTEYELKLRNNEVQFMVLQSQINPHFLYNTLQTIGGKAILNGEYEINSMCKALSDIFRYSIKSSNQETTIDEEIQHMNNYLYIQKIRFQDSVASDINIEQGVGSSKILRLVLQPIIENSIIHGLEKSGMENILITVSIWKQENNIIINIEDSGPGIKYEKLQEIRLQLEKEPVVLYSGLSGRSSIGIRNVHARLKLFYGEEYGIISIDNKESGGLRIKIAIPYSV